MATGPFTIADRRYGITDKKPMGGRAINEARRRVSLQVTTSWVGSPPPRFFPKIGVPPLYPEKGGGVIKKSGGGPIILFF